MTSQTKLKKLSGICLSSLCLLAISCSPVAARDNRQWKTPTDPNYYGQAYDDGWARTHGRAVNSQNYDNGYGNDSADARAAAAVDRQSQQDDAQFDQYQNYLQQMQQVQSQALRDRFNATTFNRANYPTAAYPAGYNSRPTNGMGAVAGAAAGATSGRQVLTTGGAMPGVQAVPAGVGQAAAAIDRDLGGELSRTRDMAAAKIQAVGTTQRNEEQRVRDLAAWETRMARESSAMVGRTKNGYTVSTTGPSAADQAQIDYYRDKGLGDAQTAARMKTDEYNNWLETRSEMLSQSAQSLKEQLAQPGAAGARLQSVGTNLYVRQYGDPGAVLPPVHNAAARIVPHEGPDK